MDKNFRVIQHLHPTPTVDITIATSLLKSVYGVHSLIEKRGRNISTTNLPEHQRMLNSTEGDWFLEDYVPLLLIYHMEASLSIYWRES